MAGFQYLLKTKKNPATIYLRLTDGTKRDWTVSTGYVIDSTHWSKKKKFINEKTVFLGKEKLTKDLINLKSKVLEALNRDKGSAKVINSVWLKNVIALYKNPLLEKENDLLLSAIKSYKQRLEIKTNPKTEKPYSKSTIRNFNTTLYRLKKFEESKKKAFYLNEIDLKFHEDFERFAINELTLGTNSIGNTLKQIKTVCIDALDRGKDVNQQILSRKFNAPTEKTTFVTLTKDDIRKIKKFDGADYLNNARDWLLIGCWTGCRVGDLMKLTKLNLMKTTKGFDFIQYTQSKTNKQVNVPLHEDVKTIVKRLDGFPRPISNVKFNKYMKTVCKESGIIEQVEGTRQNPKTHLKENGVFEKWELVRSHTCRRSFATNHYNVMSNKAIMSITGHSTEKMLLTYIGETQNNHLDDFIELWNNESLEQKVFLELPKKTLEK